MLPSAPMRKGAVGATGPCACGERLELHRRLPFERVHLAHAQQRRGASNQRPARSGLGAVHALRRASRVDDAAPGAREALRDLLAAPHRVQERGGHAPRLARARSPPGSCSGRRCPSRRKRAPSTRRSSPPHAAPSVPRPTPSSARPITGPVASRAPRTPRRCGRGGAGRRTRGCRARAAKRAAKRVL